MIWLTLSASALTILAVAYADSVYRDRRRWIEDFRAVCHRAERAERERDAAVWTANQAVHQFEMLEKALADAQRWRRVAEQRSAN